MAGKNAFQVEGVIAEVLPRGTYRVELSNGHRLLAFVPGKTGATMDAFRPGDVVKLQLSPGDLSQGRIMMVETKQI